MRYGFYLPTRGPTATRDGILALAREGERLGLHSAMIADHIVFPVESESTYPYTLDGKHPGAGDALETFSILGVVAGATEKLRLVTSVLVLPYRNPVLTAKMAASLDVLSGGRVTLGVGVGWLKEEFEALDSPDFERRGAVTDEWIAIFKQLWTLARQLRRPVLQLRRYPLRTLSAAEAASADLGRRPFARRVAPHGAAWRRLASGGRHRRFAAAAAGDAGASGYAEADDRSRRPRLFRAHDLLQGAALRHRRSGSRRHPPQLLRQARRDRRRYPLFAAIGVHELIFDFRGKSIADSIERLQRFAAEVIPLVS